MYPWSYSSIKTFEQCPKKYYHTKVAKDFVDKGGVAARYGGDVHKAAEDFFRDGVPIPEKYNKFTPVFTKLLTLPGDFYPEYEMGLRRIEALDKYETCDFHDADCWYRGIADLLIVNGQKGRLIDFKTGKNARYADVKQLDMMAAAAFVHFPALEELHSALLFIVSDEIVQKIHHRRRFNDYVNTFEGSLARLEVAKQKDVWNPSSGPLCRFCPVQTCAYWRD